MECNACLILHTFIAKATDTSRQVLTETGHDCKRYRNHQIGEGCESNFILPLGKRWINPRTRLDGKLPATLRCENLEIHKVFLRFSPLIDRQFARQSAHVDLFSVSLVQSGPLCRSGCSVWAIIPHRLLTGKTSTLIWSWYQLRHFARFAGQCWITARVPGLGAAGRATHMVAVRPRQPRRVAAMKLPCHGVAERLLCFATYKVRRVIQTLQS